MILPMNSYSDCSMIFELFTLFKKSLRIDVNIGMSLRVFSSVCAYVCVCVYILQISWNFQQISQKFHQMCLVKVLPSRYLHFQSQQGKQKNVRNLFKVGNKETRTVTFSGVLVVKFEQFPRIHLVFTLLTACTCPFLSIENKFVFNIQCNI